jgi:hypothetical protein
MNACAQQQDAPEGRWRCALAASRNSVHSALKINCEAIMSFLKSLFGLGGKSADAAQPAVAKEIEYKGFAIAATPYKEGGQYQTAGRITKEIAGERKEHSFIRADRFSSLDEAVDCALSKGRQIIDEQGDRLFG